MRFGKSCFNATLYKKNLTRFWPVWSLYLGIWMFVLPLDLVLSRYTNPALRFSQRHVLQSIGEAGLVLSVAVALLTAVAVWSYLFNNRSTCLMHSMPVRREGLFLTNFLSGMTFFVGPNLVVFLVTLLAEMLSGCLVVGPLVTWLIAVTLMELFFFCFATFCAMFTGHILGLPAYYGILSVLPMALVALLDAAFDRFVFGYAGIDGLYVAARLLSPIWALSSSIAVDRVEEVIGGKVELVGYEFAGWTGILIYAAVGLVLAGLALVVYRRRHMERAGDAVTVAWVRPVFRYGVAFCCALAFGVVFFEIFSGVLPETAWTLLVLMLISGTAGYFLAKMVLEKSFRVFGCWKGCLPFLAALVVLVCVMEFDLTGYERRVPDENRVKSVTISDVYTMPYDEAQHSAIIDSADPEVIRLTLDLHQTLVDNKAMLERDDIDSIAEPTVDGYYVEIITRTGFNVSYLMENGDVITRDYNGIPVYSTRLDDVQTISGKLNALVNLPQAVENAYGLVDEKAGDIIEMTLTGYEVNVDGMTLYNKEVAVSKDAYRKVFEAVMADFAEGNIGRRYLMNNQERMDNCFANDLEIVFYRGKFSGTVWDENGVLYGDTEITAAVYPDKTEPDVMTERITVTLQTTSRHTLAALAEAGVLTGEMELLTQSQRELLSGKWSYIGEDWETVNPEDYIWAVLAGEE